jgi:O-antigen ligase
MITTSTSSRNLLLVFLLIAGSIVFLSVSWNFALELPLLGIAGLGVLFYVGDRFPEWFLVAAVFAPQWKTFSIFKRLDNIVDLTIAMLACLIAALAWRLLFQPVRSHPLDFRKLFFGQGNAVLAFFLFALIITASYVYTNAPNYGGSKLARFLTIGFLFFIAPFFLILTEENFRRFARAFVAFSVATALQLIYTLEHGSVDPNADITRIGAGWLLGMAAILVLFYPLVPSRRGQRALFIFALPLCVAGLVASAARGPILALAVAVVLGAITWLRQGRLRGRTALVLLLLLSAGFGGAYFIFRQADLGKYTGKADEFATIVTGGSSSGSAGKRLDFYKNTLAAIPNHLMLGTGIGSWSTFYYGTDLRNYPHNLLLEITFEEGVIGLAAFSAFLFVVGAAIFRMQRESRSHFLALALIVLYCVIVSLFSGDLDDNRLLWLWAGITLAICRTVRLRLKAAAGPFPKRAYRRPSAQQLTSPWPPAPAYSGRVAMRRHPVSRRGRAWREKFVY